VCSLCFLLRRSQNARRTVACKSQMRISLSVNSRIVKSFHNFNDFETMELSLHRMELEV
jgi:hypothetical protein